MIHAVSLVALVAVFAAATALPINMGVLAFLRRVRASAPSPGSRSKRSSPSSRRRVHPRCRHHPALCVAKVNNDKFIDLVITASLKLVRGRRWAIVWVMFALAAILMSLGSVLAAAMLAPVAMPIAARYRINPLLMGMMLMHGMLSTAFPHHHLRRVHHRRGGEGGFRCQPGAAVRCPFRTEPADRGAVVRLARPGSLPHRRRTTRHRRRCRQSTCDTRTAGDAHRGRGDADARRHAHRDAGAPRRRCSRSGRGRGRVCHRRPAATRGTGRAQGRVRQR